MIHFRFSALCLLENITSSDKKIPRIFCVGNFFFFFLLDSVTDRVTLPLGEEFYDRHLWFTHSKYFNGHSFLAIQKEIR